ncbi:methyltransferase domain-containing protein [Actinomadura macrotermitis]|uniref:Ubiquinone/menaquinone biosynthesis C-methyltransferase UbiE n=1 Tax=Actinomadura macrotermitis TaxID=2585200 RepID=A0A7K0C4T2_9ACTN|nr:class I SAM-dependent methyltransferase [Actinomadura macrotermitis]MQY08445.1 Ubiquinone/menaquinone biosynthesis C-methyltransferase UbiE [Actinomadura macrotermitis]
MLDYDREAPVYDATRGGDARARAAEAAIEPLLPADTVTIIDVACGTGIVTRRFARPGRRVAGVDLSAGMLSVAAGSLGGRVLIGDARRMPLADGSADAVLMVWLLHMLGPEDCAETLAEAARLLRPGGVLITTVDKNAADFAVASDVSSLLKEVADAAVPGRPDAAEQVVSQAGKAGLVVDGEGEFVGVGQGRSPRAWSRALDRRGYAWMAATDPDVTTELSRRLLRLPDPDVPRPDPRYRLLRFAKPADPDSRRGGGRAAVGSVVIDFLAEGTVRT